MNTPEWSSLTKSIQAAEPTAFALVVILHDGTVRWGADYGHDPKAREAIVKYLRGMHLEAKRLKERGLASGVTATSHTERGGAP
jgi:hypothetical protein